MKILLAEDEKSLSRALCAILEKNNYSVDPVYNGEDALEYLQSSDYDAAILDIMMPKLDGISVLKALRNSSNNVPVIMLTAKSEIDDKVEGLDSGANDYLTKPFDSKELLARLRVLTRSSSSQADSVLRFGNITLDRSTCDITGPSGKIKLAGKEFQMLEMMMMDPGVIISAEKFMDKIWSIDSDADVNVIWTFISYLRKKLTSVGADISIKASRGQGYYLEENK